MARPGSTLEMAFSTMLQSLMASSLTFSFSFSSCVGVSIDHSPIFLGSAYLDLSLALVLGFLVVLCLEGLELEAELSLLVGLLWHSSSLETGLFLSSNAVLLRSDLLELFSESTLSSGLFRLLGRLASCLLGLGFFLDAELLGADALESLSELSLVLGLLALGDLFMSVLSLQLRK